MGHKARRPATKDEHRRAKALCKKWRAICDERDDLVREVADGYTRLIPLLDKLDIALAALDLRKMNAVEAAVWLEPRRTWLAAEGAEDLLAGAYDPETGGLSAELIPSDTLGHAMVCIGDVEESDLLAAIFSSRVLAARRANGRKEAARALLAHLGRGSEATIATRQREYRAIVKERRQHWEKDTSSSGNNTPP